MQNTSRIKALVQWISLHILKLFGWKVVGKRPDARRYVLIAAPHTSNLDFFIMYPATKVLDIKINWMGKASLFRGPLGPIVRALGGIPVRRDIRSNMVEQMAQALREADDMGLLIPVAGTRKKTPYWKSGFYYIALQADVPVALGFLDYARKEAGIGPVIRLTGDVKADMDKIRAFYKDIQGRFPHEKSVVRLKVEDEENENASPQAQA